MNNTDDFLTGFDDLDTAGTSQKSFSSDFDFDGIKDISDKDLEDSFDFSEDNKGSDNETDEFDIPDSDISFDIPDEEETDFSAFDMSDIKNFNFNEDDEEKAELKYRENIDTESPDDFSDSFGKSLNSSFNNDFENSFDSLDSLKTEDNEDDIVITDFSDGYVYGLFKQPPENAAIKQNNEKIKQLDKEIEETKEEERTILKNARAEQLNKKALKCIYENLGKGLEEAAKDYEKKKPMIQAEKQSRNIKKVKANSKKKTTYKARKKDKYIIGCILFIGFALLMGLRAGTVSNEDNNSSPFMCLLKIFTKDDFTIGNPDLKVASTVFFIMLCIEALVILFVYLDKAQKKASRIGHEHGMARIGNKTDLKNFRNQFMENTDNNMLFSKHTGLSLDNKMTNRSANVLVIGGTGTGKTFRYIKPNILQENCSMVITDPSGDIFRSFAPYLLTRGYNVYIFNLNNMALSNHYNPLLNVYDSNGEISEIQVDILVDLYMKNAKAGKESGGGDPFWDKSEKAFITGIIYYILENDAFAKEDKCFNTVLRKVQEAKAECDENGEPQDTQLTKEIKEWQARMERQGRSIKTPIYYDTFLIAPEKTANTILITTAVDLQIFATSDVDRITRYNTKYPELNINLDDIATTQSYLFLGIPQSHQAYNFLVAMLYSQLYGRLYELGERKLRNKWHIGEFKGIPKFAPFDSKEQAEDFFKNVTTANIEETEYVNATKMYLLKYKNVVYKKSIRRETIEELIHNLNNMQIWQNGGGDPSLPIHVNFLLDEFKNIGEIPNFLTILSTSRKYRIGSHVVIQDIGQIKTMYKDGEHETLLANVDTTIFLGSILHDDKEAIQKMLGKTTIRQKSTSSSNSGISTSYTPTEVDLLSLDQISAINQNGRNDCIVIVRDCTPFVDEKLNLLEHKRWKDVCAVKNFDLERYYINNNSIDIKP